MTQAEPDLALDGLGTGSSRDRMPFRLVVRLLVRCVHLLRPVRRHLVRKKDSANATFWNPGVAHRCAAVTSGSRHRVSALQQFAKLPLWLQRRAAGWSLPQC